MRALAEEFYDYCTLGLNYPNFGASTIGQVVPARSHGGLVLAGAEIGRERTGIWLGPFGLGLFTMEKLRIACFPTSVFPIIQYFPPLLEKESSNFLPRVRTYPFSPGQVLPARRHGAGLSDWGASSECFRTNIREKWQSKNVLCPPFFFLFRARKWHSTGPSYILVNMGGSERRRACKICKRHT